MFFHVFPGLADIHIAFNLFNYLTFRSAGALVTALLAVVVFGPGAIARLKRRGIVDVPRAHHPSAAGPRADPKANMGGVLIVLAVVAATLLWAELANPYTLVALSAILAMAALGFVDDYLKVVRRTPGGLVERYKWAGSLAFGALFATGVLYLVPVAPGELAASAELARSDASPGGGVLAWWLSVPSGPFGPTIVNLPILDEWALAFPPAVFVFWVTGVLVGTTHAVNLSDGLDGLAPGLVAIASCAFAVFAYVIGRVDTSAYLGLFHLPGSGELAVFAAAITGATLGFLWFNAPPAKVIMGDTGALGLGGALGAVAILLKAEILLAFVGGVFVLEAGSSLIQKQYFKYSRRRFGEGRRVFLMAPLHHHYQKKGWADVQIVIRFWIVGVLFAMVGFAMLKLR